MTTTSSTIPSSSTAPPIALDGRAVALSNLISVLGFVITRIQALRDVIARPYHAGKEIHRNAFRDILRLLEEDQFIEFMPDIGLDAGLLAGDFVQARDGDIIHR